MRIGILEADRAYETSRARIADSADGGHPDHSLERHEKTARGAPLILEVNTLPGLQPGYSDITKMAGAQRTLRHLLKG
jgi:hypothetical protein